MQENMENTNMVDTEDKEHAQKSGKIFSMISWIILVITAAVAIFVSISAYKTMVDFRELTENYKDAAGDAEEIYQTIIEIKSLYDTYGIQGEADERVSEYNAVYGYMSGLNDKYSFYFDPDMNEEQTNSDNEAGFGIGIYVSGSKDGLKVLKTYKGAPAEIAGVKKGDIIISAGETEYSEDKHEEFINLIKGNAGDIVNIQVLRGSEQLEFDIEISEYTLNSVDYYTLNDVAVITITDFTLKTADEFKEAIDELVNRGIEKFVIDLRYNGGGFMDTVVEMIDYIVPSGVLVQSLDRDRNVIDTIKSDSHEVDGEFVVITNEVTASASELFAQSIKDFNKGITVGTTTYGKSTIVGVYQLKNGGAVRISTGYVVTNSGTEVEGVGVIPNIEVESNYSNVAELLLMDIEDDIQLQTALNELR